jgi:hypothetical protein
MGLAHPSGWKITSVRLSRGGPPREHLRLTSGSHWIGDFWTLAELAAAFERHGLELDDFSATSASGPDGQGDDAAGRTRWG